MQVNALHVTGETLFSEEELIAASGFTPGSRLSLADLRALAAHISAFYNDARLFPDPGLSAAAGHQRRRVTIAVLEGRYGECPSTTTPT